VLTDPCRPVAGSTALPGRIGRVLFAYLVLNRGRPLPRGTLLMAGWGEDAPAEAGNALSVLLSKLRHGLGAEHLRGRAEIELLLPPATFVDAEAALESKIMSDRQRSTAAAAPSAGAGRRSSGR
jgi:DNA-binding SARP family transcriptional activator